MIIPPNSKPLHVQGNGAPAAKVMPTHFFNPAPEEAGARLNFTQVIESPGSDIDSDKGIQEEAITISNPMRQSMNRKETSGLISSAAAAAKPQAQI